MKLLLDLGNTRLKVAVSGADGRLDLLGEAAHRAQGPAAALAAALGDAPLGGITAALCANVAGQATGQALAEALHSRGVRLAFLRATRAACGVQCAYPEPARLGADRWAALLGARDMASSACLVVDAGSALTIDALDAAGRHLGGWIIPGLAMMVATLEARTGDLDQLRRLSAAAPLAEFPADTGPAMEQGALLAASGAVRAARAQLEAHCGAPARLLVTGGDAGSLANTLADAEQVPGLVLRGLARAAAC